MQEAAAALQLECWQPETVNSDQARAELTGRQADLLVVCDYGEILKPATLAVTPRGGINLHASLLPKYRGAAPVQWAVLNGDFVTGNTVIEMTPGLDAGPCLATQQVEIDPDETACELEQRLALLGARLVCEVVDQIASGSVHRVPQDPSAASRAPRLSKEDGELDWGLSAVELHNRVRGLQPWPRAYTHWLREAAQPQRLVIHRAAVESESGGELPSGTLCEAGPRLLVQTGEGRLELLLVQPAGKRVMAAADFLRGSSLKPGDYLG
jgi:methionyl-tRNA formyltransferase